MTTPNDGTHTDPADIFSGPDELRDFLLTPDGSDLNLDLIETHNVPERLSTPFTWVHTQPCDDNNNKSTSPASIQGVPDAIQTSAVQHSAVPETAVNNSAVPETAVNNSAVPKTAVSHSAVPETAVSSSAVFETALSPRAVCETADDITTEDDPHGSVLVDTICTWLRDENDRLQMASQPASPVLAMITADPESKLMTTGDMGSQAPIKYNPRLPERSFQSLRPETPPARPANRSIEPLGGELCEMLDSDDEEPYRGHDKPVTPGWHVNSPNRQLGIPLPPSGQAVQTGSDEVMDIIAPTSGIKMTLAETLRANPQRMTPSPTPSRRDKLQADPTHGPFKGPGQHAMQSAITIKSTEKESSDWNIEACSTCSALLEAGTYFVVVPLPNSVCGIDPLTQWRW